MMNKITLSIILILPFFLFGQDSNIFYGGSFWETDPTIEEVKSEIAKGNSPTELNSYGFDATVFAIINDASDDVVLYLLSLKGNPVNKHTHDGRNYLMWSGYKGRLDLMKYLVSQDSRMDIVDDHGHNIMTFTASGGQQNTEVYDLLLANGAKIDDVSRDGANVLHYLAPTIEDDKIVEYFTSKGLSIHAKDNKGWNLFHFAARKGALKQMKKYVDMGLDYKSKTKDGGNAMLVASMGYRGQPNSLEIFEYLDKLGIEANITNDEGKTPLHYLAYRVKDEAVVDFFIDKGVDIYSKDEDGNTFYLNAIDGENYEIAEKYYTDKIDINHSNAEGYSALSYAVMNLNADLVAELISKGADVKIIDSEEKPLIYHLFSSYESDKKSSFEAILKELKAHQSIELPGNETLLHVAVLENDQFLIDKALDLGADINAKNDDGLTPLHLAVMKAKDNSTMQYLIQKGADKTIKTDFEESVYELAEENEALSKNKVNIDFLKIN